MIVAWTYAEFTTGMDEKHRAKFDAQLEELREGTNSAAEKAKAERRAMVKNLMASA